MDWYRFIGAIALALGLSACGSDPLTAGPTPEEPVSALASAHEACDSAGQLADEGKTLIIDTKGEEDGDGDSMLDLACLLIALETPDSVVSHLDTTRALDGMQTNEWDDLHARWTYHPDRGLNLTITVRE